MRLRDGRTACELINTAPEKELSDIFFNWGEERYARRIAHEIVRIRKSSSIRSSKQLAQIIWEAVPPSYRYGRIHPATRSFQALRIAVNQEMERLERALKGAFTVLKVGGRLGVLSFHSLEDRRVKQFFQEKNKTCICGPETPICNCRHKQSAVWITRKVVQPTPQEVSLNAASRSAKFRVIEKIEEESTV
jgi:16S rRNA (cytosine1402-N4)-methyltransferase